MNSRRRVNSNDTEAVVNLIRQIPAFCDMKSVALRGSGWIAALQEPHASLGTETHPLPQGGTDFVVTCTHGVYVFTQSLPRAGTDFNTGGRILCNFVDRSCTQKI